MVCPASSLQPARRGGIREGPGILEGTKVRVTVWDLPTRLFHWLLALAAIGLYVTGKIGGDAMVWHARLGYAVGALLLFRLVWGFAGGHWSRFATFVRGPSRAWAYLGGRAQEPVGHNPLGAFSVLAMLLFFGLQVTSGLFSETKEDFAGPLSVLVSHETARQFTTYHKQFGEVILLVLVALHVLAIAAYALRGRNLLGAMITGAREVAEPAASSRDDGATRILAAVVMSLCSLAVWWLVKLGG